MGWEERRNVQGLGWRSEVLSSGYSIREIKVGWASIVGMREC